MSNLIPYGGTPNLFRSFFGSDMLDSLVQEERSIRADIHETKDSFVLEMEMPGYKREDIAINLERGVLTVSAATKSETAQEDKRYIRRERRYGKMSRSFYVDDVREEQISACYENGLLTVNMPKRGSGQPEARKIDIN